jgi:hypothetical protein
MSINFNLLDIKYQKDESRVFDPLITKKGSKRGVYTDNLRYPLDLGSADKGHYMMFTIFEQEDTAFKGTPDDGMSEAQQSISNLQSQGVTPNAGVPLNQATKIGSELLNTVSNAPWVQEAVSFLSDTKAGAIAVDLGKGVKTGLGNEFNKISSITSQNFLRRIRKITESVALYMPDTLAFQYNQGYTDVSMYQGKTGLAAVGASALDEIRRSGLTGQALAEKMAQVAGANLSPFASYMLSKKLGAAGDALFAGATGNVMNPSLELLYTSPSFREFQFDFMFYPRSESEAKEVWNIINAFKFHQAPEIKPGQAGFFLIPPSVFNIDFYYNGKENMNLPKISDCVLTSIQVDYAPNGWASYEVPSKMGPTEGGTGTPVATRMTLGFKETFIHTKGTHVLGASSNRINR